MTGSGWDISESGNLYFEYLSTSGRESNFAGQSLLHLGSIALPYRGVYALTVQKVGHPGTISVFFDGSRAHGCAFSVGSVGNYTINFTSGLGVSSGRLEHDGIFLFAADVLGDNFFPALGCGIAASTTSPPAGTRVATAKPTVTETLWASETRVATAEPTGTETLSASATRVATGTALASESPVAAGASEETRLTALWIGGLIFVGIGIVCGILFFVRCLHNRKPEGMQKRLLRSDVETWTTPSGGGTNLAKFDWI
jgi:hypothetical protein